jgi:signal transduction histidine kinase
MISIGNIENRFVILFITLIFIIAVAYLDYITGSTLTFYFFYIIPISFLALYKRTTYTEIFACAIASSFLWFWAEYAGRQSSNLSITFFSAFIRFLVFNIIGLLILYLKQKQKHIDILNTHLKNINQEKNKFLGIVAHDLRNPLGNINAFSDYLIKEYKGKVDKELIDILGLMQNISGNTMSIVDNLLDISKIESGRIELTLQSEDLIGFIKQHIHFSQRLAKQKQIVIKYRSTLEKLFTRFDNKHLSEVIDNLLSNAIKYSKPNSEILVKISQMENKKVLTEIIDSGRGIPEAEQKKLFRYFQTTSTKPTAGEKSTGLGLAIAKQLINLHKGEIGVKSSEKSGSNFYFTLPIT